ncbi:hypothetical protein COCOBI_02-7100 [Coccomyxa sp. Obi]|nr:hypothetical protein COCOBI_02-7100 [Coccomyxa sp. Obi]
MTTCIQSAQAIIRPKQILGQVRVFGFRGRPFTARRPKIAVTAAANSEDIGTPGTAAIALGALANPLVLLSDYTLYTTGRGLPEGPGGLYGAAEGISYLVILGVVGWSLATKARTGSGLPAGPSGLLGAVEGFSYLTLLVSIVVFGLQIVQKGSLPGITG